MSPRRLVLPAALAATLLLACAQSATAAIPPMSFLFTGSEQSYTVPPEVHSIHLLAIGAHGGKGSDSQFDLGGLGGPGARVEADLAVQPGEQLFIEIGGVGGDGSLGRAGKGGFNGGAGSTATVPGGGGGGATDLRTCSVSVACVGVPDSLASRLIVAAGGGGGGSLGRGEGGVGGEGGAGGQPGGQGAGCAEHTPGGGGQPGTQAAGGAGGAAGSDGASAGVAGALLFGGSSGGGGLFSPEAGGGGGGGFFGGGGGGSSNGCTGGGGGGGSSFADPRATNVLVSADPTDAASVVITALTDKEREEKEHEKEHEEHGKHEEHGEKPSNLFKLGKLRLNRRAGTAVLAVRLPGAGQLALKGKGLVARRRVVAKAGQLKLLLKSAGKSKRALLRRGSARLRASITFTPNGGDPRTQTRRVKLIKKLRR